MLTDLTGDLRALGGQRVWSLMVSLFGDLARKEGAQIEGPVLSAMMAAMQVRPEAARVALHRLRNDDWIASEKQGRISRHSLTAQGLRLSAEAAPRIYAAPDGGPEDWQLILLEHAGTGIHKQAEAAGFTQVSARVFVGSRGMAPPKQSLSFQGDAAPDWLIDQITPRHLEDGYHELLETLDALSTTLPDATALGPLEVAVLRCLIVHNWRRLVLKHPALPRALIDKDWAGHRCHQRVATLLAHYPRPDLSDIKTA